MASVLSEAEVDVALVERGLGWVQSDGMLVKVTRHGDFGGALAYVNQVGALAEEVDHHPDIDIRWDTVTLYLVNHSAGGITPKDLSLAATIDGLDQHPA